MPNSAHILIVDDEDHIHDDYRRSLGPVRSVRDANLDAMRGAVLGNGPIHPEAPATSFDLTHAYHGVAAEAAVHDRAACGERFAVAFVDMRMPPGWNGIETVRALRGVDPKMLFVICTAHSDFTWDEVLRGVGDRQGLYLLRKPFNPKQVRRYAAVLAHKWALARRSDTHA